VNPTVFFDIGDTLASAVQSGTPPRTSLQVYPYVRPLLDRLLATGVPLGLVSDIGPVTPESSHDITRAIEDAQLAQYFPQVLRLYGRKDSAEIFVEAARRAHQATEPGACVFVGEDSTEREWAHIAGLRVCPHPLLVTAVLRGESLGYVRITVPDHGESVDWRPHLLAANVVPLYIATHNGREIYAIAAREAATALDDLGFLVDRLGGEGEPLGTELFLLRDDRQQTSAFMVPVGNSAQVFTGASARRVISSTRDGIIAAIPGHTAVESYHFDGALHGHTVKLMADISLLAPAMEHAGASAFLTAPRALRTDEVDALGAIDTESIRSLVDLLAAPTTSRHILHDGNKHAVDTLFREFQSGGGHRFSLRRHRFTHQGRTLFNVEAELPGVASDEIVIVGAHLDSTARSDGAAYDASRDSAPGADDDASGVAAVLLIARAIERAALSHPPERTLRFVLFNAEEDGLVGSKAYARRAALASERIVGCFLIDMIGFRPTGGPPSAFEIHTGFPASPDVASRSMTLASIIPAVVPLLSPTLTTPEIYSDSDPAAGRSDHASFQERGYAACVCSENAFAGPAPGSPAEINPNYHKSSDRQVDSEYAAAIARVVGGAALIAASR
jgi:leucyl aminopeptidase